MLLEWCKNATGFPFSACRPPNECQLVWEGVTRERAFEGLVSEQCRTEAAARKFFADRNLGHLYDLAAAEPKEEP